MFRNFKLATKFTLLLSLVFMAGIIMSGVALSNALEQRAEEEILSRSLVLMETMNSLRNYTNTQISPLLASSIETQDKFIPESIPSYSVREVFEKLRQQRGEYKDLLYKDATLNPTNLRDQADFFETLIIEQFRTSSSVKELAGFRSMSGKQLFYKARPIQITQDSCLRCHSTPEAAPRSQIATYGKDHGFGWVLNEIVGAQIIYIPADEVLASARRSLPIIVSIFIGVFAAVILLINFLLKRNVIQPIGLMARLAQKISTSDSAEFDPGNLTEVARRADELGQLGRVFEQMAQEVYAREQRLKQQLQELRIEIDEAKKERQVAEITDSEYFQDLQKKARELRKRPKTSEE